MGKVLRESGEAVLGCLVIDWANRKIDFHGMTGNGPPDTSKSEIDDLIDGSSGKPNVQVMPLIFWKDEDQLSVHDAGSWDQAWVEEDEDS